MAKNFTNLNPQHGDDEITLLGKLLQKMGGQPNWGDTVKSLLAKILSAFTASGSAEQSFQFSSSAIAPSDPPADANLPAQHFNTATGFVYNWNISSAAWVPVPKVYRALLTQSDVDAPVAVVLENTLGTITYARVAQGVYSANSAGLFVASNKMGVIGTQSGAGGGFSAFFDTASKITFETTSVSGQADDQLFFSLFEILVYP